MMSHSPGLHLTIAEWILERGEAVSAYDVSEHFGITIYQAKAFLTILEKDSAIETQRGRVIPASCRNSYRRNARTIKVISVDREKITQRRHHYNTYRYHPLKTTSDLTRAEKWEMLIRNTRWRRD
ncbi:TPA: FaeA/PapI family transcriptional regulator [Salmonella enterica]|nr:hypothetical protein [Salmonella enterica subsp. enterica serovar Newport]ECI3887253.1 hypothetical protein [Salmonella enterica subsp. enterica serovar Gombe]EDW2056376.1 hypothetical protein [Salmonella enterica subsp. enterica]EGX3499179.1 hypothetical protein [Salmonella enterica]EIM5529452.1 hypothetical protein [Salmonella enterica subsp. enterica]